MNDQHSVTNLLMQKFADDICCRSLCLKSGSDLNRLESYINGELNTMVVQFRPNKHSLNFDKTNYMIFQKLVLKIGHNVPELVLNENEQMNLFNVIIIIMLLKIEPRNYLKYTDCRGALSSKLSSF